MTRLRILNVLDAAEWEQIRHAPRAVQPVDFSPEPCVRCPAPCCAAVVRLTTVEALRIAFTLAIDLEGFLEPTPFEGEGLGNGAPLNVDGGEVLLRLQHRSGGCVHAYMPQPGRVRCGSWAIRPGACRVYPHTIELDEHHISVGSQKLCEVKWVQTEALRTSLEADVQQWLADLDAARDIAARWNDGERGDRSFGALCTWLIDEVAAELGHDAGRLRPPPARKLGKKLW